MAHTIPLTVNNLLPVVTPASFPLQTPTTLGQSVGTVQATNNPTSWAITAGDPAGNFAISASGLITVTVAGVSNLVNGTANLTVQATNAGGSGSGAVTINYSSSNFWGDDGHLGAPAGLPQFPNGLAGYAVRPPWQVAGVDYAVGPVSGTVFKAPQTGTPLPAGVTRDTVNHVFAVTQSNVVIDGWDFSQNGGWSIEDTNSGTTIPSNTIVRNCKWTVGANNKPPINMGGIDQGTTAVGLTVENCLFDGQGLSHNIGGKGLIGCGYGGTIRLRYNLFQNAATDFLDLGADRRGNGRPCILDIKYNAFVQAAQDPGGHTDWLQTAEVNAPAPPNGKEYGLITMDFNYTSQTGAFPGGGGCQGWTLDANLKDNWTDFGGGSFSFNVAIANGTPVGAQSYITRIAPNCVVPGGSWHMNNNYVDPRGLQTTPSQLSNTFRVAQGGGPYSTQTPQESVGNFNLVTGLSWNRPFPP